MVKACIVIIFWITCFSPVFCQVKDSISNNLKIARGYFDKQDYNRTRLYCQKVLEKFDPGNPDAFLLQGRAEQALGDYEGSIRSFDNIIRAGAPIKKKAYYGKGVSEFYTQKFSAAIEDFSEAIRLDSSSGSLKELCYYFRGYSYATIGKPYSALSDYNSSMRLKPGNSDTYLRLCEAYQSLSMPDSALVYCDRSLSISPSSLGYYYKGKIYLDKKQLINSKNNFLEVLNLKDSALAAETQEHLAAIEVMLGNFQASLDYSAPALALSKNAKLTEQIYHDKTVALFLLSKYEHVIGLVKDVSKSNEALGKKLRPFEIMSYFGLGKLNKFSELLSNYSKEEVLSNYLVYKFRLFSLLKDKKYKEWIALNNEFCRLNLNDPAVFTYIDPPDSVKQDPLDKNIEIISNIYFLKKQVDTTINFSIGIVNNKNELEKIFDPLMNELIEASKTSPDSSVVFLTIAQLMTELKKPGALYYFDKAVDSKTGFAAAFYLRGKYKKDYMKDQEGAKEDLKTASFLGLGFGN